MFTHVLWCMSVLGMQNGQTPANGGAADAGDAAGAAGGDAAAGTGTASGGDGPPDLGLNTDTAVHLAEHYGLPALKVLIIFIVAWIIAGWAKRIIVTAMERARIEPTVSRFVGNLGRWTVLALAIIAILGVFGIPTASFAVVLGAMGLAIGLALQGTLGNAASGFLLLIFRPFKAGDFVNAAGVNGTVVEIELFSTILDTPDKRRIIVPNSSVFGATIENVSHHPLRRVDVSVGVSYDADTEQTRQTLLDTVMGIEERLEDPAPAVVLTELADSSVNWVVRVWVNSADFWPVKEKLTERIKRALDAADIGIPYPQMDVHLKGRDAD